MKKIFGVFGDPIGHSLSPLMHNVAFSKLNMDCTYHAFKVKPNNLENAILGAKAMGFGGVNLTVPLKEEALKFIKVNSIAKEIGAVNTIDFKDEIIGYNTDGIGAKRSLLDAGIEIKNKNILIVGAGGAARGLGFQFGLDGANITIANRTESRAIKLAEDISNTNIVKGVNAKGHGLDNINDLIKDADILINTTTIGMHPNIDDTIAYSKDMRKELVVFDIVYNPLETCFLKEAKKAGAICINGLMMFIYQGAESFKIWTGIEPPVNEMKVKIMEALSNHTI